MSNTAILRSALRRHRGDVTAVVWIICFALLFISPALKDGPSFAPADLGSTLSSLTAGSVQLSTHCLSATLTPVAQCAHNGINGDQITQSIPWANENWLLVHKGELPLWNDLSATGMPQMMNFESATLALPSLVSYLVPLSVAFLVIVLMKLLICGIGAYVLARMLRCSPIAAAFAGTTAMLSGSFAGWLGWSISGTVCWVGFIAAGLLWSYRAQNKTAPMVLLALSVAFSIYGGFPEGMVIEAIALLALFGAAGIASLAMRDRIDVRGIWRVALGSVVGLMLGAPLWLPGISVLRGSIRSHEIAGRGIELQGAALIFAQGYDGLPIAGSSFFATNIPNYFETAAYVGVLAAVFALLGTIRSIKRPVVVGVAISALVCLLLAYRIGNPGIVQSLITHLGVSSLVTSRSLPLLGTMIAILAGIGLQHVIDDARDPKVRRALVISLALVTLVIVALGLNALRGGLPPTASAFRRASLYWPVALLGGFALVMITALDTRLVMPGPLKRFADRPGVYLAGFALIAQSAFLLFAGVGINSYARTEFPTTSGTTRLAALVGTKLVALDAGNPDVRIWLGDGLYPEMNIDYGIDELAVHDPAAPTRLFTSWPVPDAGQLDAGVNLFVPSVDSVQLARRYGAAFILVAGGIRVPPGTTPVAEIDGEELASVPDSARFVATGGSVAAVAHPSDTTYDVSLNDTTSSTTLVAHITQTPGWSASVDGKALQMTNSDGVAYSMAIPKGTAKVVFHYRPPHLVVGIGVGLFALFILLGDALVRRRPRRRSAENLTDVGDVAEDGTTTAVV